jgi:hypothetical protein
MTAGKGIMHSEMPRHSPDGKPVVGVQLWVDLAQRLKFAEPRYRDLRASEIPSIHIDDGKVHVKIISGKSHGIDSVKELAYTPVWILDIQIKPGGKIIQELPQGWTTFAYTLSGNSRFGVGKDATSIEEYHNVIFEQEGDSIMASVADDAAESGRFRKPFPVFKELGENTKSKVFLFFPYFMLPGSVESQQCVSELFRAETNILMIKRAALTRLCCSPHLRPSP